jgi:hypothetical protein
MKKIFLLLPLFIFSGCTLSQFTLQSPIIETNPVSSNVEYNSKSSFIYKKTKLHRVDGHYLCTLKYYSLTDNILSGTCLDNKEISISDFILVNVPSTRTIKIIGN